MGLSVVNRMRSSRSSCTACLATTLPSDVSALTTNWRDPKSPGSLNSARTVPIWSVMPLNRVLDDGDLVDVSCSSILILLEGRGFPFLESAVIIRIAAEDPAAYDRWANMRITGSRKISDRETV